MFNKVFSVKPKEPLKDFLLSPIKFTQQKTVAPRKFKNSVKPSPYEYETKNIDNEYPGRDYFLKHLAIDHQKLNNDIEFKKIYSAFEDDSITLSSEVPLPTLMQCWALTYLDCKEDMQAKFKISTAGGMKIWINGKLQCVYKNYTRNTLKSTFVRLNLEKGSNKIIIYFDELAERDVDFIFSIQNNDEQCLHGHLPVSFNPKTLEKINSTLESIYFLKDYYSDGDIKFYANSLVNAPLRIRFNPPENNPYSEMQTGDITEFKQNDLQVNIQKGNHNYTMCNTFEIQAASLTKVEFGLQLPNKMWITRTIVLTIYNTKKYKDVIKSPSLTKRKLEALQYYSHQNLDDINIALAKMFTNTPLKYEKGHKYPFELESAINLIESHGDCADFILAPLLMFISKYPNKVPELIKSKLHELCLNFRYWTDEPGNDVMWFFSENHALLFHVAQYLAGYLYPNEVFTLSKKSGTEQYKAGKNHIEKWFNDFFKYGLAEWNSLTYMPIDLISFFCLQIAAPDKNIRLMSKKALDFCFLVIGINSFGKNYSSTYGRVYEHNLKNTPLSEVASLTKVAFNVGYFNDALRDVVLFCLSDYSPDNRLTDLISPTKRLKFEYLQGINKAHNYIYKTPNYSLASVINYKVGEIGVQQHLMNISLKGMATNVWINNPGEFKYSGDHKPSYWAGNNRMPSINQFENYQFIKYELTSDDIQLVHLYNPFWEFDEEINGTNWVAFRKANAGCFIHFSNPICIRKQGVETNREIISKGQHHFIFVTCFDIDGKLPSETELLKEFKINDTNYQVKTKNHIFEIKNNSLYVDNNIAINRHVDYLDLKNTNFD